MTSTLPPNLLRLFAPRPPPPFLPPILGPINNPPKLTGLAAFVPRCAGHDADYAKTELPCERKKRMADERAAKHLEALATATEAWDPQQDKNATLEPYLTLFVARLSYNTTEKELKRHMEIFGDVKQVRIVKHVTTGKSRGYGFVEFAHESDMKRAYRECDGIKIDGRRIIRDVERGRTVPGWKPRRLAGGLGGTRNIAKKAGAATSVSGDPRSVGSDRPRVQEPSSRDDYSGRDRDRDRHSSDRRERDRDRYSDRRSDDRLRGRDDGYRNGSDRYSDRRDRDRERRRSRSPRRDYGRDRRP